MSPLALLAKSTLSLLDLLLVALAALGAGVANALAGGGTFITFPTLIAVGLSPTFANITNTVALSPGYLGGTWAQRRDLIGQRQRLWPFITVGIVGGLTGGLLLIRTQERVFDVLVPFLILGATLLLAFQERMRTWVERRTVTTTFQDRDVQPWGIALVFLASTYGGYFGAGLGIMLLAVIGLAVHDSLTRVNALKQATSFCVNISAAIFFMLSGKVAWDAAVAMAVGAAIGGVIGGGIAGRIADVLLRRIVVAVGLLVAFVFFVRLL